MYWIPRFILWRKLDFKIKSCTYVFLNLCIRAQNAIPSRQEDDMLLILKKEGFIKFKWEGERIRESEEFVFAWPPIHRAHVDTSPPTRTPTHISVKTLYLPNPPSIRAHVDTSPPTRTPTHLLAWRLCIYLTPYPSSARQNHSSNAAEHLLAWRLCIYLTINQVLSAPLLLSSTHSCNTTRPCTYLLP